MTFLPLILAVALEATSEGLPQTIPDDPMQQAKPRIIPAAPQLQPPPGYRAGTRPNIVLVATGGGTFLTTWLISTGAMLSASAICGLLGRCNSTPFFLGTIPLVGPIIMSATVERDGASSLAWTVTSSAIQLAGLGVAIAGFLWPKPIWILETPAAKTPVALSVAGQGLQLQF